MISNVKKFLKTRRKWLWATLVLICLAVASLAIVPALAGSPSSLTTQTSQVERGTITEKVDSLGVVAALPSASLIWESNGIVSNSSLKVGDQVEKDETLLSLDDSSISSEILQARNSLLEAQAELEKKLASDAKFQAALEEVLYQETILKNKYTMRHEFYGTDVADERVETVYANYNTAREEVRELELAYEKVRRLEEKDPERIAASIALQTATVKRDSLLRALSQILGTPYGYRAEGYFIEYDLQKAVVDEARAAYERLLDGSDEVSAARAKVQAFQNTINQANIVAPFSGTVTAINAVAGEKAGSGEIALQLDDLSNLVVDVQISQMEINKIQIGQSAELTFDAIPNSTYSGTVLEIGNVGIEGENDTYFDVRVGINAPDDQVKPGFTVTVSIITNHVDDALLVPNTAIQYNEAGEAYVMAGDGLGGFTNVPIQTGARSDAFSELVSGELDEGVRLAVVEVEESSLQFGMARRLRIP